MTTILVTEFTYFYFANSIITAGYIICAVYNNIIARLYNGYIICSIPSRVAISRGKKCCIIWVCYTGWIYIIMCGQVGIRSRCMSYYILILLIMISTHRAYDFMCNFTLYDVMLAYKNEKHSTKNHLNATFKSRKYDWERVFFIYYTYTSHLVAQLQRRWWVYYIFSFMYR